MNKSVVCTILLLVVCFTCYADDGNVEKTPVDYVNPYIGNISHLLVPTYPTIHLPNSMMRVRPRRDDYTGNLINGLPIFLLGHRSSQVFSLHPFRGEINNSEINPDTSYLYDHEVVKPYFYSVYLDNIATEVKFSPSHQSAIYEMDFLDKNSPPYLFLNARNGELNILSNTIFGYQQIDRRTKIYIYAEAEQQPVEIGIIEKNKLIPNSLNAKGRNSAVFFKFSDNVSKLKIRYGISCISVEQAKKNLYREIPHYNLDIVAEEGRNIWNEKLSKIQVIGDSENDKIVFYTSLYRTYERMISISEDGKYYSAYDGKIHDDEGIPFYVDDWLWDTYRATHPLRVIIEPEMQTHMINSFIRIAEQSENFWMPNFPELTGDSRCMNANHGVAVVLDCYRKGLTNFDLEKAYRASKNSITEKTLIPWSARKAGVLDEFYKENGYFPALESGEKETVQGISEWEKRQPVAVTLGTVYDEWCLANIAYELGNKDDYNYFIERSLNYRKIFNPETKFFHPKDKNGKFIEPFDYRYSAGLGARDAYDENNGWIYRWDLQHNFADLVKMIGGNEAFVDELERMYNTPLGKSKWQFYADLPDHTGNVGQFSMANEPCLHIPYLYNYAGEPWRTQKRIRELLKQWFRNDLMGVPGDEDGGGMTAFVVFSSLGFYPVTPGLPMYAIGSPLFKQAVICLGDGKTFEIICQGYSVDNKYIQSAKLNGIEWNKSWFSHHDLMQGGRLELVMGRYPNKQWGSGAAAIPPSFVMVE